MKNQNLTMNLKMMSKYKSIQSNINIKYREQDNTNQIQDINYKNHEEIEEHSEMPEELSNHSEEWKPQAEIQAEPKHAKIDFESIENMLDYKNTSQIKNQEDNGTLKHMC